MHALLEVISQKMNQSKALDKGKVTFAWRKKVGPRHAWRHASLVTFPTLANVSLSRYLSIIMSEAAIVLVARFLKSRGYSEVRQPDCQHESFS